MYTIEIGPWLCFLVMVIIAVRTLIHFHSVKILDARDREHRIHEERLAEIESRSLEDPDDYWKA